MKRILTLILFLSLSVNVFSAVKSTSVGVLYDYYLFPAYEISKQSVGIEISRRNWYSEHLGLSYNLGLAFPFQYKQHDIAVEGISDSILANVDFSFSYKYDLKSFGFGTSLGVGAEFEIFRLSGVSPTIKLNLLVLAELFISNYFNDYVGIETGIRFSSVFFSNDIVSPAYSYLGFSSLSFRPYIAFSIYTQDGSKFGK